MNISKTLKIQYLEEQWALIQKELDHAGETSAPVEINFEATEILDTAGLQLVLFLLNFEKEHPDLLHISGLSETIKHSIADYGFEYIIGGNL